MTATFDVIVVGLGAMGSATAYHLAARGARVLGIDQYDPPHDKGSSHGESRIIRQVYYEHPLYVPLVQRAFSLWRKLEKDSGEHLLTVTGGLMLGRDTSGLIQGCVRAANEHLLPIEQIRLSDLQERFPQFMPIQGFTALLDPAAGFLAPESCIRAHLQLAAKAGATIQTNEEVVKWGPTAGGGVRVQTSRGVYEAGKVVIAAGPWARELVGAMGPTLMVERQTVLWFQPPGERSMWTPDRFPIYMCEFEDGQLVYGFPLQDRGWKAAVHYEGEEVRDVRATRRDVQPHDVARVRNAVARLFPWVSEAKLLQSAVCYYTDTQDLRFVIDFLPGMPQVLLSSPCSGHGFKFASAIGELQAALVMDGKCDFDLSPFRIDR